MPKPSETAAADMQKNTQPPEDIRYTRFTHTKTRAVLAAPVAAMSLSEHDGTVRSMSRQPASRVAVPDSLPIDENAHLYADTGVSVAVLRRALPQRFADLV